MSLEIGLAQINPTLGDLKGNTEKITTFWQNLDKKGAHLVVFPELSLCGYPPEDLTLKPTFLDEVEKWVNKLAKKTKGFKSTAIIGAPWRINHEICNCAVLIHGGEIKQVIAKHHLPNYGVFDEKRIFKKGDLPEPVKVMGVKVGVMVCEDMWFSKVSQHLKKHGAKHLIVINGSPFDFSKKDIRLKLAQKRVSRTKLPLVYVNQVGGQDELVFDGNSFALNDKGKVICSLKAFEEDASLISDDHVTDEPDGLEALYDALCLGVKDYVQKNGFSGVLIGLSGGIDSALTTKIAVDALGAENVDCVMLPSPYTSNESLNDAKVLADNLKVKYENIHIEEAMNAFGKMVPQASDLAKENIQSRIRGLTLMALSNTNGKMLLTTGNKSEMAAGYATLYGDMCGGFNALKDVYKTQVFELCRWLNRDSEIIPENIITKAPSAELKPNQTDQDSLPPYDVFDGILENLIEHERSVEEIMREGYDRDTIIKVWSMLDRTEYKRVQAPPGVKVTPKSFGKDRRYPITNKFFKGIS